ncbi:MAG: nuclear transport factor 2 family protein [Pyrinomonadaceae bacterium]|nr:nuclear transport factor 2 family protein [Pyrinomonadaceae bacterium]
MRLSVASVLVLALFALGSSQLAQRFAQDSKERELRRLEDEWLSSYLRADKTIFDRIVAEDFTGTDESAKVRNKAQARELIQVPPSSIKASLTNEDVQFRIYGDTAVVTGRIESAGLLSKTWMVSALNARRVMPSV